MKQREARFGFNLNKSAAKDPKDPELMKKRAAKFGVNKPGISVSSADDEARKKVR